MYSTHLIPILLLSPQAAAGADSDDRWILDDWPVFECSPPPDEVILFVLPESSSDQYFNMSGGAFWTLRVKATSWIQDVLSDNGLPLAVDEVPFESDWWATLSHPTRLHPTVLQGEQTATHSQLIGSSPGFTYIVGLNWTDGPLTFATYPYPDWFAPASLCLSLIRDDRLMGAAWFETEGTIFEERFPTPLYLLFDSVLDDNAFIHPSVIEHEYTDEPDGIRRLSSMAFTTYTGTTADEVWSLPTSEDTGG